MPEERGHRLISDDFGVARCLVEGESQRVGVETFGNGDGNVLEGRGAVGADGVVAVESERDINPKYQYAFRPLRKLHRGDVRKL